jgi:glycosyltransferase involved in cell wall biosynthesis
MANYVTTIGITSFNRFKYVKALLNSLSGLSREKFHFVVVDNCSKENGLQDYIAELEANGEIHQAFIRPPAERNWVNDEYIAKNIIIENSPTETILFLQDDLQFIGNEKSLENIVADFQSLPGLCVELNGIRKISNFNKFLSQRQVAGESGYRYWASDDNHFQTMGLFKKQAFNMFGNYPVAWPNTQEYWGRSEDVYDLLIKKRFPNMQLNISAQVPMFLPVWNDIRGGYAFIRGDRRYGQYTDPPHPSGLYYQAIESEEYAELQSRDFPLSFPEVARPLGWDYARDNNGDQKKYSQKQVMEEEFGTLVAGSK